MSTPNPLIPQGTFQAQAAKGASNVRLAVATIVAIHIVFFGGLLLQGCKRDTQTAGNTAGAETNAELTTNASLALPPLDSGTNSLFYNSAASLPTDSASNAPDYSPLPETNGYAALPATQSTNTPEALWQANNLGGSQLGAAPTQSGSPVASGPMKEYKVARNDNYTTIARAHRTTVSAIKAANPGVNPSKIRPGDKLMIPEAAPSVSQSSAMPSTAGTPSLGGAESSGGRVHTVKAGENLTRIAKAYGVTITQISTANNLRTSRVSVGQKLKIPARTEPRPQTQASNGVTASQPRNNGL